MPNNIKIYPQAIEAERAVLCSILLDNAVMADVLEGVKPEDFFDKRNCILFKAMVRLYEQGNPVDVVTLTNKLKEEGILDEAGGYAYCLQLPDILPTASNASYYAEIIRKKSVLRKLIDVCTTISTICYSEPENVEETVDLAQEKIFDVSEERLSSGFVALPDTTEETAQYLQMISQGKLSYTGIPSGFTDLDKHTGGFQKADLIIVAGRPSMGKTAFVLNVAINAASTGQAVAVFSLEMSVKQLVLRVLSSVSGVDGYHLRTGYIKKGEWDKLANAFSSLENLPIYIDDTPMLSVLDVRARARKIKLEKNVSLIIIDYLQLIRGMRMESRVQEITEISRSLKILAKELNIPVIAVSQLNRGVETRDNKMPILADLRESGAIEQDADVILFIYRDEIYNEKTEEKNIARVKIGKQRNGPAGMTIKLSFFSDTMTFKDLAKGVA
ncbi:MAG: replicative DNA helicase [Deltaproteobacteria bacterium]|nr:replicative DNA helicase [Deltaproteobacteria bacterium]